MASFSLLGELTPAQILRAMPPNLRRVVELLALDGERYHVILFDHNQNRSVTTSAAVRRALRRVPSDAPVLAVGRDFTQEATDLLVATGATIARSRMFGWTDASYIHVHDRA